MILFVFLLTLQININRATLDEIKTLPIGYQDAYHLSKKLNIPYDSALKFQIPEEKAESIYYYISVKGPIYSYYQLLDIKGVNEGDLERWQELIKVSPYEDEGIFSINVERIRERAQSEEAPRESSFDEWINLLVDPINVNRTKVDELYKLYGVSLIDAASVVRYARVLEIRNLRDLRRVPGLSSYGYRNMRNFVTFRDIKPPPVFGWINFSTYYNPGYLSSTSELQERINDLYSHDTLSLRTTLVSYGWSQEEIDSLISRINQDINYIRTLKNHPSFNFKSRLRFANYLSFGFLINSTPNLNKKDNVKYFVSLENLRFLKRFIYGYYRVTFGSQGLMVDNTEELRDRVYDRPFGISPDLTRQRTFNFFGPALSLSWKAFDLDVFYSHTKPPLIFKKDGKANFYYTGEILVPSAENTWFSEKVNGFRLVYEPPKVLLPTGTQVGIGILNINYSDTLHADFLELDIPGDRYDIEGDPSIFWQRAKKYSFFSYEARYVKPPFSIEFEGSKQLTPNGGNAFIIKSRTQFETHYIQMVFRHYPINYTNPYSRPFQEDSRFEFTNLQYPYRLIHPLYSSLSNIPIPKPETGFYFETRYQFSPKFLITRSYIDVWRDLTDGLLNFRTQLEFEYRPVHPLRLRYRHKWQIRENSRFLSTQVSHYRENNFRIMVLLSDFDFFESELRYSSSNIKERVSYPRIKTDGGFVSFAYSKNFGRKSEVKGGLAVWKTNGMSQWIFEDTGIDFLYGDGSKIYVVFLHRPQKNISFKIKGLFKTSIFRHTGLFGRSVYTPDGRVITSFNQYEPLNTVLFTLDYAFF